MSVKNSLLTPHTHTLYKYPTISVNLKLTITLTQLIQQSTSNKGLDGKLKVCELSVFISFRHNNLYNYEEN